MRIGFFVCFSFYAAGLLSPAGMAQQCTPHWTGAWSTNFGQLRLVQDGTTVYGDYASLGTIKARTETSCGTWLRGVFERKDGGWGFIEFNISDPAAGKFDGRWNFHEAGLPSMTSSRGAVWTGQRTDSFPPPVINFKPGESRSASSRAGSENGVWLLLGDKLQQQFAVQQAENRRKQEEEAHRKAEEEAYIKQQAEARLKQLEEAKKKAAPLPLKTQGVVVDDGFASYLAVGLSFDEHKARTAVSMQEHVQNVSTLGGGAAVLQKLRHQGFVPLGDGVVEGAGLGNARLRAYVARKGNAIVVVFRGTQGENIGETFMNAIMSDAPTRLVTPSFLNIDSLPSNVRDLRVHTGFQTAYNELRPRLMAALKDQPDSNLFIFGHSLGGAMATLMSLDVATNKPANIATITHIVSGSPRVGNKSFSDYFHSKVPDNLRLMVDGDPIPLIPQKGGAGGDRSLLRQSYVHAGRLLVVNANGNPVSGDAMNVSLPVRTWHAFKTYHDNEMYLTAIRNMQKKLPELSSLSPNGTSYINQTSLKERQRTD